MVKKRFQAEQIIGKLREVEVNISKGQTIGQIVKNTVAPIHTDGVAMRHVKPREAT